MITIEQQQQLLLSISRRLKQKVTCYAIGGTAMMFHGSKEATLDVDIIFLDEKERQLFIDALLSLGFTTMSAKIVYGDRKNKPLMYRLGDVRFDLFLNEIIYFSFSKTMQERATQTHDYSNKLMLKIADLHDIIILKCATDRMKDKDDVKHIIEKIPVQWDTLLQESLVQIALGHNRAAFELGCFLEDLRNMKVNIPMDILDKLSRTVEKQAKGMRKK